MAELLTEQLIRHIEQAAALYHRLVLLVAPSGSGKTSVLLDVVKRGGFRYINVNLDLSRCLLDLTERQRALQVPHVLAEVVGKDGDQVVLLDNIEILFAISLKQDPLRLLQGLSRHQMVAAAWNGTVADRVLFYAKPDHPEYRRYPVDDLVVVSPQVSS